MSRSFRKHPCFKDQNTEAKRGHNRKIRSREKVYIKGFRGDMEDFDLYWSPSHYRKENCPWDICDFGWVYWTEWDYVSFYHKFGLPLDEAEINRNKYRSRMK